MKDSPTYTRHILAAGHMYGNIRNTMKNNPNSQRRQAHEQPKKTIFLHSNKINK
jgi:hypothetical protein